MSLEVIDLECVRNDRVLFEQLSFVLKPGMALQIEGPNGSGKTSLLRILCGLTRAESGIVKWNGQLLTKVRAEYQQDLVYVGHHHGIKDDLTLLENLKIAQAFGLAKEGIDLDDVLDEFGLFELDNCFARWLSAGQRRRLALARLRVLQARLWILDEPFTALDRHVITDIEDLLSQHLAANGIIILTSHHQVSLTQGHVERLQLGSF